MFGPNSINVFIAGVIASVIAAAGSAVRQASLRSASDDRNRKDAKQEYAQCLREHAEHRKPVLNAVTYPYRLHRNEIQLSRVISRVNVVQLPQVLAEHPP